MSRSVILHCDEHEMVLKSLVSGAVVSVRFTGRGIPDVKLDIPNGPINEWPETVATTTLRLPDGREARAWLSLACRNVESKTPDCKATLRVQRGEADVAKSAHPQFTDYSVKEARNMGLFGWSLPPGCSTLPGEEPDLPCEVCGLSPDNCICPECPACGEIGRASCYVPAPEGCDMVRTPEQIATRAKLEEIWKEDAAREAAFWDQQAKEKLEDIDD